MGEKVTSIFERAIDVFGRRDDVNTRCILFFSNAPFYVCVRFFFFFWDILMCLLVTPFFLFGRDDGDNLWQVDVDMMEVIFTSLVEYLQLEDAYNIFILNPKHAEKRVKYGYR